MPNQNKEILILKSFLKDIDCLKRLDKWTSRPNVFDIFKISGTEIRHSNFLAWLLNPNENHGLGDGFTRRFILYVRERQNDSRIDPYEYLDDYHSFIVEREKDHIDVLLYSNEAKKCIVIENKVYSKEHGKQLKEYKEAVQNRFAGLGMQFTYVYLTLEGDDPSEDSYIPMSYEEMIELIQSSLSSLNDSNAYSKRLINDYIDNVRYKLLKHKDLELVEICSEIYAKYGDALKLIYENTMASQSTEMNAIITAIKQCEKEGLIKTRSDVANGFWTEAMDKYLPPLEDKAGSWGKGFVYWYWFELLGNDGDRERTMVLHLEIGDTGLEDRQDEKKRADALAALVSNKKTRETYRYYRIWKDREKFKTDYDEYADYSEAISRQAERMIKKVLGLEKDWLEKLS